ncbi:MAG: hypothetical protein ACRDUV_16245 [Pseudonocardiaceae bacterium]
MVDDQCVGVTDDSHFFREAYRAVQEKIAKENARVDGIVSDPDAPRKRAVTVALLHPMTVVDTSAFTVEEVRNTLEGAYTAPRPELRRPVQACQVRPDLVPRHHELYLLEDTGTEGGVLRRPEDRPARLSE